MCTSTTRSLKSPLFKTSWEYCGKRFTHRAPDFVYLTKGVTLSSYYSKQVKEGMQYISTDHPQLFSAYLKTAATMISKGKIPLVHGQRASWNVAFRFTQHLSSKTTGFFKFLRPFSSEYLITHRDLTERIDAFMKKHGKVSWTPGCWGAPPSRLDEDSKIRPHLISASYALMGNFASYESAFFFTFRNGGVLDKEKEWKISEKIIHTTLKAKALSEEKITPLLEELKECFDEYADLTTGNLVLIGVPKEKLSHFAYDAKSFGIPTGTPIEDVVSDPLPYKERFEGEEGGFQARLRIFKETLDPRSGMDVIIVNDPAEVEAYCEKSELTPPEAIDVFKPLVSSKSEKEEEEGFKRKALEKRIKALAFKAKESLN